MEFDLKKKVNRLRVRIDATANQTKDLRPLIQSGTPEGGEAHANVTLAFRHLEDARMRLGKVIQALDGGTSCYAQKPT